MTAKKSAKKCTAFRVFVLIKLLLLYLFFFSFVVVVVVRARQERCDAKQNATVSFDDLMRNARRKRRPQVPIERIIVIKDHYKTLN